MAEEEQAESQGAVADVLSERFAQLVALAGGPTKASRDLGLSRTTLDQWTKRRARIPLEAAVRLAMLTGQSLDAFALGGAGRGILAANSEPEAQQLAAIQKFARAAAGGPIQLSNSNVESTQEQVNTDEIFKLNQPHDPLPDDFIRVPMLQVSAAAGRGRFPTPDDLANRETVAFREVWLRTLGLMPGRVHILWAVGDSMEPTINDGDMMLVDRMTDHVLDGGIYVVVVGGAVMVKRLQTKLNGSVVLKSDNARYDDEIIPTDEVPSLIVEGRVRWVGGPI